VKKKLLCAKHFSIPAILALFLACSVFAPRVIKIETEKARGGFESHAAPVNTEAAAVLLDKNHESPEPEFTYTVYRIKQGDMIGLIAESNGVTQDTLISVNGINNTRAIQIGSYIKIPSLSGIRYTVREDGETIESIAKKYEVEAAACSEVNRVAPNEPLKAGATIFVPGGELDTITLAEINGDLFRNPLKGSFRYFSDFYGWRRSPFSGARTFHQGVDMVGPRGSAIYAAMEGRVSTAGWSDTYGNYVIVAHHSGYRTLYAHLDSISVTPGRWVTAATKLGTLGNTGLSTGPHLHFSVYKNNATLNPRRLMN
jgi:murein DD-endopeptidase MepM/ murein hydrolase activator NlpD